MAICRPMQRSHLAAARTAFASGVFTTSAAWNRSCICAQNSSVRCCSSSFVLPIASKKSSIKLLHQLFLKLRVIPTLNDLPRKAMELVIFRNQCLPRVVEFFDRFPLFGLPTVGVHLRLLP